MPIHTTESWPQKLIDQRLKRAAKVTSVHVGSPADKMGIKAGWTLLQIDTLDALKKGAIRNARLNGAEQLVFLPDTGGDVHIYTDCNWPNGMGLVPAVGAGLIKQIMNDDAHYQDIDEIWTDGQWQDFEDLKETYLSKSLPLWLRFPDVVIPFWHSALRKLLSEQHMLKLAASSSPEDLIRGFNRASHLRFLALSLLANSQYDEALAAIEASERAFAKCEIAMTASFHALPYFVRALVAYHTGDVPKAKDQIATASSLNQSSSILGIHSEIHRSQPLAKWAPQMQKPFPVAYDLPRFDCFGTFHLPDHSCALQPTLDSMKPGQFCVVILLSSYRSNGPMQKEIVGLRSLYKAFPDTFAAVHVITSSSNPMDGWREKNKLEEDILKTDLNYQIGFDEHDDLADALDLEWAPSVYILDHQGIVLSVESLADEKGFWQAMRHRSDPDFQRGVDENLAALSEPDTGMRTQGPQTAQ